MFMKWAKTIVILQGFALFVLLTTSQFVDAFENLFDLVVAVASLAASVLLGVKLKRSLDQLMEDTSKDQARTNPPAKALSQAPVRPDGQAAIPAKPFVASPVQRPVPADHTPKPVHRTTVRYTSDPEPTPAELEGDEMLPLAVDVVLETKQASVSMIQRHLKVGYARAARIMDEMEEKGIVGPFEENKPRQILITKDQWEQMKEANTQRSYIFDVNALFQYLKDRPEDLRRVDTDSEMAAFLREYTLEREIRTSVKGVTFRNDDGSNRQSILARCHRGDGVIPIFYRYNGDPAYAVITDYGQIGVLSADLAQDIHDGYANHMVNGEILAVTGGDAGRNLGCNIVLRFYRKIRQ